MSSKHLVYALSLLLTTGAQGANDSLEVKESTFYNWNSSASEWTFYLNITYVYNPMGDLTEITQDHESTKFQTRFLYDSTGRPAGKLYYTFADSSWVFTGGNRLTHKYTPEGFIEEKIEEQYDDQVNQWINQSREIYTYDQARNKTSFVYQLVDSTGWLNRHRILYAYGTDQNLLTTTYQAWTDNAWKNSELYTYTYSGDSATGYVVQRWEDTTWENAWRYTDITWHDEKNKVPLSYIMQEWTWGAGQVEWVNDEMYVAVIDKNGGHEKLNSDWVNNAWRPTSRDYLFIDDHGNTTGRRTESFIDNEWQIVSWLDYQHNYIQDELALIVARKWDAQKNEFRNLWKEEFTGDSNTSLVSDIDENILVYPNPVKDRLQISLAGESIFSFISLMDMNGRALEVQSIGTGTQNISFDLSNHSSGLYILHFRGKEEARTIKFIKR